MLNAVTLPNIAHHWAMLNTLQHCLTLCDTAQHGVMPNTSNTVPILSNTAADFPALPNCAYWATLSFVHSKKARRWQCSKLPNTAQRCPTQRSMGYCPTLPNSAQHWAMLKQLNTAYHSGIVNTGQYAILSSTARHCSTLSNTVQHCQTLPNNAQHCSSMQRACHSKRSNCSPGALQFISS